MLETFISSRIRRALFEYILAHPSERFYLRGLAKSLGLSVSPLRREIKRLEHSGMLQAAQEGNMLFYMVNTTSQEFLQLQQAGLPAEALAQAGQQAKAPQAGEGLMVKGEGVVALDPPPFTIHPHVGWRAPLPTGALIGAAGVGMALLVVMASLLAIRLTDRTPLSQAPRMLSTPKAQVDVMPPDKTSTGVMHGSRWRIVPGGIGGFSSGSGTNSGTFSR